MTVDPFISGENEEPFKSLIGKVKIRIICKDYGLQRSLLFKCQLVFYFYQKYKEVISIVYVNGYTYRYNNPC